MIVSKRLHLFFSRKNKVLNCYVMHIIHLIILCLVTA